MDIGRLESIAARNGVTLSRAERESIFGGPVSGLLTIGNPKTLKGQKKGYRTAGLHLAPSIASGLQVCPKATAGCAAACLNTAGRGSFDRGVHRARRRRTWQFMARRPEFMARLVWEIRAHVRSCERDGYEPAVRLNVLSDIRWENVPVEDAGVTYPNLMTLFPGVTFYDYTKIVGRGPLPANYSLTFSAAESNGADVDTALGSGMNVAVVFRSLSVLERARGRRGSKTFERSAGILMRRMDLPAEYNGRPVIDGDESDLRFLDGPGVIVGLRAKGRAATDSSGFVREIS